MDGTGFYGDGSPLEHETRRLHKGATARHFVVNDEGNLTLDVADQIDGPRVLIVRVTPLVHDRDWKVQVVCVQTHFFRFAHVASH